MKSTKLCNYVGQLGCLTLSEKQCGVYRTEIIGVQIDEWKGHYITHMAHALLCYQVIEATPARDGLDPQRYR